MFFGKKRPPLVPDPGQRVELVTDDGSRQSGFRAVSGPLTSGAGDIVIWVATEDEYLTASREGRRAVGLPWPAHRVEIPLSPTDS